MPLFEVAILQQLTQTVPEIYMSTHRQ